MSLDQLPITSSNFYIKKTPLSIYKHKLNEPPTLHRQPREQNAAVGRRFHTLFKVSSIGSPPLPCSGDMAQDAKWCHANWSSSERKGTDATVITIVLFLACFWFCISWEKESPIVGRQECKQPRIYTPSWCCDFTLFDFAISRQVMNIHELLTRSMNC